MISQNFISQAVSRLGLQRGSDHVWRGCCPRCHYSKTSLGLSLQNNGIALSCVACGNTEGIAAAAGIPTNLIVPVRADPAKVARAVKLFDRAVAAAGTPAECYIRGRGIDVPVPTSIRFLQRQRNWVDSRSYAAMACLVERVTRAPERSGRLLHRSGIHLTFLGELNDDGIVRKAATEHNKLTLGQLRYGGVWLTPINRIGEDLAVAEGPETALSVQQVTRLPTVAALSASGLRSFRWPPMIKRLWIAADRDEVGLRAAKHLRNRAESEGIHVHIRVPARGMNDFNDLIQEKK